LGRVSATIRQYFRIFSSFGGADVKKKTCVPLLTLPVGGGRSLLEIRFTAEGAENAERNGKGSHHRPPRRRYFQSREHRGKRD
jgi:hypothetical protein